MSESSTVTPSFILGDGGVGNGESYLRIGDALGRAVADLVAAREAAQPPVRLNSR